MLIDTSDRLWMFALNRYSIYTNDKTYNDVAIQLAKGEGMKPTRERFRRSRLPNAL